MRLYCVRHGETAANANHLYNQLPTEPLSEIGMKQAQVVANRLKDMTFDELITSDYTRAMQTGEIIQKKYPQKLEAHTTPLLRERKGHTKLRGIPWTDPVVEAHLLKHKQATTLDFKEGDEETIGEIVDRAHAFLEYASSRPGSNILVISHGIFLNTLMLVVLVEKQNITAGVRHHFFDQAWMDNTGITIFDQWEPGNWYLRSWNDHSHL